MDDSIAHDEETAEVALVSLAAHLALSPVAFAITEGSDHGIGYANTAFRQMQSSGAVVVCADRARAASEPTDICPLLDRAFHGRAVIRDELIPSTGDRSQLACTIWPIPGDADTPDRLVIELRDASYIEGALARQRAIAERLLISALREQDAATAAADAARRSEFLASASKDLSMSLDQDGTRDVVRRRSLPREGTWCIVDVIESNGGLHRLAVIHPDASKQALASTLTNEWSPLPGDTIGAASIATDWSRTPTVITHDSGEALRAAAHGAENLAILKKLGFGALLVVPLVIRATVIGAITFVTRYGDPPFSQDEITLASDLTDRCAMALENARLYQQADALRATANAANVAKSEFLRNISHELRTPLNAIGGYAELIEMGLRGPVTAQQRTDLTRIKRSQRHLLGLISEILNFVRSESGRMEYRFADISVEAAIQDVVEMMEASIEKRSLALDRHPVDGDIRVWADPDRVRQILINLVMNAVKYTPRGGKISISYTMTRYDVIVQVADSGSGIPSDMLETIFEPFVQLESGLSDRRGGVGLGLAISRDMARAMNGDLTVDSTLGIGSRFTLALPRTSQGELPVPKSALPS
jgi:signal transduction histidine kinase